jgi:hypothetical protein
MLRKRVVPEPEALQDTRADVEGARPGDGRVKPPGSDLAAPSGSPEGEGLLQHYVLEFGARPGRKVEMQRW